MKESLNTINNFENNKSQILTKSLGLFKYYTLNCFKNIYSFYPLSFEKIKKEININNQENINNNTTQLIDNNKNYLEKNKENQLLIYNGSLIKKNINIYLEKELKINNTKIELKNNNNNKLTQIIKYKEFKTKTFIYFFSSIILQKYYNIISITSLCIISIMKNLYIYSNQNQIKLILDILWNITNQTSKNIFSNISKIISNYTDKILLNEKYTQKALDDLIFKIENELRDKCNFFLHIVKEIKKEINNIEEQFYIFNDMKNNMLLEYKLRFLYIFCDLLFSDLFYSSFVQTYEEEIGKQIEEIKKNFVDKIEKSILAIIFDIDSFRNKQLVINEEKNDDIDDINDKDDILMNYQRCLQSIFM